MFSTFFTHFLIYIQILADGKDLSGDTGIQPVGLLTTVLINLYLDYVDRDIHTIVPNSYIYSR